ncbi:Thioredoxin-dependent peroxiredoxin [Ascochyta rabiei]|uniref:thioredoxin-dependent peroxiredoxin n=1 Tax=Didymella rabiei TaxID=5454 RepID=A0A163HBQ5_DIDRA|nr:Thioredoxin-dependent peroxiredoxin [Ascochyta rabiei]KZM25233.1 antioxidant [Ascochyta rabiei]UPX17006.1 Thioredoxin-dependent peroxiredoxin [Ascochyta rabiei]
MVELRKRKTPPPAPARPAKKASAPKGKKSASKKTAVEQATEAVSEATAVVTEAVTGAVEAAKEAVNGETKPAAAASSSGPPKAGDTIDFTNFGAEIETQDGKKTTLAKLVEESKGGVVLFTYPKASTPGCTTQACLFRDSYATLTATGFSIYGLSNDSPKANTTFKTKQNLPYNLLCDPGQTLISAIGLKKAPKGTTRGVFVVNKDGKVLASEPGSPAGTHKVVQDLVAGSGNIGNDDTEAAKTAAEVADTAANVDS